MERHEPRSEQWRPATRSQGRRHAISLFAAIAALLLTMPTALAGPTPAGPPAPSVSPAVDGILNLFKTKPIVVLCDYHGLAQEEAFFSTLVRDTRFASEIGNVIVEFGESSQPIIDRYVAGDAVPLTELRRVWTETPGRLPGPILLGYINFFANVRAANSALPPNRRIKVWLGDPKFDWSNVKSYQELVPYLARRDDNYFRILSENILGQHRKALLIIGSGHIFGAGLLMAKLRAVHPDAFSTVMPFVGYLERKCNDRFLKRTSNWPVPALVGPVGGSWLKEELQLPGCDFVPRSQVRAFRPPPKFLPPGFVGANTSPQQLINVVSGEDADAILYLGPPDSLTESPIDPDIYLDLHYFAEEEQHTRCCTRPSGRTLNWNRILEQSSVVPRPLHRF